MFDNKNILITCVIGSYGKNLAKYLLHKFKKIKRLVIFPRDESKQYELKKTLDPNKYSCLRFFLGDVRDKQRLPRALYGIDYVFHAAALRQVDNAEYKPFEFIKTNIVGSRNLVKTSLDSSVKKVLALSTYKASSPINLYGAIKLCADKLFICANNIAGKKNFKLKKIIAGFYRDNIGSKKVLIKNSFTIVGESKKQLIYKNKRFSNFIYGKNI